MMIKLLIALHLNIAILFNIKVQFAIDRKFLHIVIKRIDKKNKLRYLNTQAIKPKQSRFRELRTKKGATHV